MMTTHSLNENLVSRPMQKQEVEFDGDLWFLTKTDTAKYDEILKDPRVNLAVVGSSYASIAGFAEVVEDQERKEEFWNDFYEKLFDTKATDPSVVLIKVRAISAEYWETGAVVKSVVNFAKEVLGKEGNDDNEVNDSIDL